jgi:hypothetical protein
MIEPIIVDPRKDRADGGARSCKPSQNSRCQGSAPAICGTINTASDSRTSWQTMEGGWKNHITAKAISLASRDTKYKSFRVCMKEYSTARKERLQCEGTKREAGG